MRSVTEAVGDMATCSSEFCPDSEQVVSGLSGVAGAVRGKDEDQTPPSRSPHPLTSHLLSDLFEHV